MKHHLAITTGFNSMSQDPLWSSLRRRLTLVFTGSKLRGWTALYQSKVADLVYRIDSDNEKGINIDLRVLFLFLTWKTIRYKQYQGVKYDKLGFSRGFAYVEGPCIFRVF